MDQIINEKLSELEQEIAKLEPAIKIIQETGRFTKELLELVRKMAATYYEITRKLDEFADEVENLHLKDRLDKIEKTVKEFHEIVDVAESEALEAIRKSKFELQDFIKNEIVLLFLKFRPLKITVVSIFVVQLILVILMLALKFL